MQYTLALTEEAAKDLELIYEEGFIKWGEEQADKYYDALIEHFDLLCANPFLYQAVDEIREGYRRSICGKHSIYYRINDTKIEMMAIVKYQNRP